MLRALNVGFKNIWESILCLPREWAGYFHNQAQFWSNGWGVVLAWTPPMMVIELFLIGFSPIAMLTVRAMGVPINWTAGIIWTGPITRQLERRWLSHNTTKMRENLISITISHLASIPVQVVLYGGSYALGVTNAEQLQASILIGLVINTLIGCGKWYIRLTHHLDHFFKQLGNKLRPSQNLLYRGSRL
jgi:hypothetical protein